MDLYGAIYKRKSLRKYSMMNLEKETLEEITGLMKNLPVREDSCTVTLRLIEDGYSLSQKMSLLGKVSAPHYIVVTGTRNEAFLISAGYSIEHLVLKLTEIGIGTCYLGHALDKATATRIFGMDQDEDVLITIAIGKAMVSGNEQFGQGDDRKRESFNTLVLEGIPNPNQRKIIEAVRVGPSYMNSQRWRFTITDDEIRLHKKGLDFLRSRFFGMSGYFDMGIAICHMELAAKYLGYKSTIYYDEGVDSDVEYISSMKLEI